MSASTDPSGAPDARAVVLIGPMGAGKTSIGRRLAKELRIPFVDTDRLVVREHGPIPTIFAEHGEKHFRDLERAAVVEALAGGGVVAVGGGAVLDPGTRSAMREHRVVLLTVSPETVRSRIVGANRPLLAGKDPVETWTEIYHDRRPLYEEVAQIEFDTSRGPLGRVVQDIAAWVRSAE